MAQETNTNHESWREQPPTKWLIVTFVFTTLLVLFAMVVGLPLGDWTEVRKSFSRYNKIPASLENNQAPVLRGKPKIQIDEGADYQAYLDGENDRLHSVKNTDGRTQIPIDHAMKLMVERGLPARKGN